MPTSAGSWRQALKATGRTGRRAGEVTQNRLRPAGIELVPRLGKLKRVRGVIRQILGNLQVDLGVGTWPPSRDVRQVLHATGRQHVGAGLELVVPDRLVQDMSVEYLGRHCGVNFVPRDVLVALGVTG